MGHGSASRGAPGIARRSGIHIVAAYGGYIDKTLPDWWRDQTEEQFERQYRAALTRAVPGTEFRAGLLGLLGTSAQLTPAETRSLRAAARVAAETGAAISVRLDAAARRATEVVELAAREGLRADRILFCNADKVLDDVYLREMCDTGAVVEFAFGSEHYFGDGARTATDGERLDAFRRLIDDRPEARLTMSCSVWTKGQLTRHGAWATAMSCDASFRRFSARA